MLDFFYVKKINILQALICKTLKRHLMKNLTANEFCSETVTSYFLCKNKHKMTHLDSKPLNVLVILIDYIFQSLWSVCSHPPPRFVNSSRVALSCREKGVIIKMSSCCFFEAGVSEWGQIMLRAKERTQQMINYQARCKPIHLPWNLISPAEMFASRMRDNTCASQLGETCRAVKVFKVSLYWS